MTGMRATWRGVTVGLTVLVGAASTLAMAQPAADLTGVYETKGGELAVVQADNESFVYYSSTFPQGNSVGLCECLLGLQKKKSPTEWTLRGTESPAEWTLRIEPRKLTLQGNGSGCCGAGWPGTDSFTRKSPASPQSCKVKAARAYFHALDEANTQRKAFVVAGDSVEAYLPADEPSLVPARFKGPKKSTAGLLKRAELDCQAQDSTSKAPAPTAVDATPLAGRWIRVERQGKGYVLRESCEAHAPLLHFHPSGDLDIDYGQEQEQLKVSSLKPGPAAGAWSLELTHANGSKEKLEWTVADAKQGIVQLKGADFFRDGPLFVREDKKAGIPTEHARCTESEEE